MRLLKVLISIALSRKEYSFGNLKLLKLTFNNCVTKIKEIYMQTMMRKLSQQVTIPLL